MPTSHPVHPNDPAFDLFLYASVGDDENGTPVSVLSAFARLDLEPWEEAADLAAMGREAARSRLELLLSRLADIPVLLRDRVSVARELVGLLPAARVQFSARSGTNASALPLRVELVLGLMVVVFLAMQMLLAATP